MREDRNFDSLLERFEQSVYNTAKGEWRLKLLQEDLQFLYDQSQPLSIWDAGCGFAQISLWFAQQARRHQITLCDVSAKILARAQQNFAATQQPALFFNESVQSLAPTLPVFDLVLFHAVLEWLAEPLPTLATVAQQVKPGGYLSVLFYNRNAMIYKNTIRGGWRLPHLLDDRYLGKGKRLTPPNPQYPHEVLAHLQAMGFTLKTHTGIRVFHDYLNQEALAETDMADLFALEYRHCRMPTFRDMGRYVHLLLQRPAVTPTN